MTRRTAIVIGSGIGGIACAIRLQSLGFDTRIVEQLDDVGGRAYVRRAEGFTFDMGPTVLTVPHFIEELFSLERDMRDADRARFPADVLGEGQRIVSGISGGPNTSRYVDIVPVLPFYRIYFDDGTFFDYDGDPVQRPRADRAARARGSRRLRALPRGGARDLPARLSRARLHLFRQPRLDAQGRARPAAARRGPAALLARQDAISRATRCGRCSASSRC